MTVCDDAVVLRIGLTGGIGAGKSLVATRLAELGALVIDADRVAREVVEPGTPGLTAVVEAFGHQVLTAEGSLDRAVLGKLVFGDEQSRERLNNLLHPLIAMRTGELLAAAEPDAIFVHDVPLLVEKNMAAGYHLVVVVHAPVSERVRRLVRDRGMTEQDARARIAAQADDQQRRTVADVWLENTGSAENLRDSVDRIWNEHILPLAQTSGEHPEAVPRR